MSHSVASVIVPVALSSIRKGGYRLDACRERR
jgi:hypothetical protein